MKARLIINVLGVLFVLSLLIGLWLSYGCGGRSGVPYHSHPTAPCPPDSSDHHDDDD